MGAKRVIPTLVIVPKRPTAGPLVDRAQAALTIDLVAVAMRDLKRASELSRKDDPCVEQACKQLNQLRSQAASQMATIQSTVEKICAKPLVDCSKGKPPGRYCSHDVAEQVANLKDLSRIYRGFEEVRPVEALLAKLRKLPGYKEGNDRAAAMSQIDTAKMQILQGKYWPAYCALRKIQSKTKDDCVKEMTTAEMAYLKADPKVGGIIKMSLEGEIFAKKQAQLQMQCLEQARAKRQTDPAEARKLYQKLIDDYPLSAAATLAKEDLAHMSP